MPHSVSTTDSPSFFQLVLFLAAAVASPQDLNPADAIFLVMNPGLLCVLSYLNGFPFFGDMYIKCYYTGVAMLFHDWVQPTRYNS